MYVRLTSKLANHLDGVDVSHARAGDLLELSEADAVMLIREGWAERISSNRTPNGSSVLAKPKTESPIRGRVAPAD